MKLAPAAVMSATDRAQPLGLELAAICKNYGRFTALDKVSLSVKPGEFLTLLGPSGSGKTTLLMAVAGFVRPDAGSVRLDGEEIVSLAPYQRGIGLMFQNYALFPHMDVAQNIAYPLKLRKVDPKVAAARVEEMLALVRMDGFGQRRIDELSGGQKQRVALARATVFRPRLLLMDEPLSALDKKLREQMQLELRRLHDELGMTTICVSHDQREALTMSDRVAVMRAGRIIQLGTPTELYERPKDAFVADFVGDSVLLPVRTEGGATHFRDSELRLDSAPADGLHTLVVRPERLSFASGQVIADADVNLFRGTVSGRIYEGESALLQVDIGGGVELRLRHMLGGYGSRPMPARGETVSLALHRKDAILVGAG